MADILGDTLKTVINAIKTFVDDDPKTTSDNGQKSLLHVGEVMDCWTYLSALQEAIDFKKVGVNTSTDDEVINVLQEGIEMCESQAAKLKNFMQREGIPLPPVPSPKPKSEPSAVPLGVKTTDDELANGASLKVAAAVISSTKAAIKSMHDDLSVMWVQFQSEQMAFGAILKTLMHRRGWVKVPPYYYPPGLSDR